jgi:hypothetical protein
MVLPALNLGSQKGRDSRRSGGQVRQRSRKPGTVLPETIEGAQVRTLPRLLGLPLCGKLLLKFGPDINTYRLFESVQGHFQLGRLLLALSRELCSLSFLAFQLRNAPRYLCAIAT